MRVVHNLTGLAQHTRPMMVAIGVFDGLHRGHRTLLLRMLERARRHGAEAWVLTFTVHPQKVLRPSQAPPLLLSLPHRLRLLESLGLHGCILVPFTQTFARQAPARFAARLLQAMPRLQEIFVGPNWRFGRNRRGTPETLRRWVEPHGVRVTVVPALRERAQPISSSRIRGCVTRGNVSEAARLLGRPFSIVGTVVRGWALGRRLGFPTANLRLEKDIMIPFGVYAVCASLRSGIPRGQLWPGVLYYGRRPTFSSGQSGPPTVELHVFRPIRRSLYGQKLEVLFVRRMRGDRRFPSVRALQQAIARDIAAARRFFATCSLPQPPSR